MSVLKHRIRLIQSLSWSFSPRFNRFGNLREHCKLKAFEQFGALYMHKYDVKYTTRPGFEPGTSRLQAPVDTNEPSGQSQSIQMSHLRCIKNKQMWCIETPEAHLSPEAHLCNSISSVLKVSFFTVYWSVYFQLAAQCHKIMFLVLLSESAVD